MVRKINWLTGAILLAGALCAQADTHYVSASGSATAPYTSWETAASTVKDASDACSEGDTIFVDSGDFYLTSWIILKPRIVLRGNGIDSTRIRGSETVTEMISVNDSTRIEDIYFIGDGSHRALDNFNNTGMTHFINDCRFSNTSIDAITMLLTTGVTIENCWFESWGGTAIKLTDQGDHLIRNCTFYNPEKSGTAVDLVFNQGEVIFRSNVVVGCWESLSGYYTSGRWEVSGNLFYQASELEYVIVTAANEIEISSNSLYITRDHGVPTHFVDWGRYLPDYRPRHCSITNNAVWSLRPQITFWGGLQSPDDEIDISYNCLYSAVQWQDILGTEWSDSSFRPVDPDTTPQLTWVGNIFADPMFVDPENGDLHLQYGSPCIDAGDPTILDVDGSRSDIGAFGGPDGEFYVYQDLPPAEPKNFTGEEVGNVIELSWKQNTESDLYYYALFRAEHSGVPTDSEYVIAYILPIRKGSYSPVCGLPPSSVAGQGTSTAAASCDSGMICYTDSTVLPGKSYFYTVVAADESLLPSDPAEEVSFLFTDIERTDDLPLPESITLEQNFPNPFNARTAIVYHLPNIGAQPAPVRLTIYNTLGRKVLTLVDERQSPGEHTAYWDGLDYHGQPVASGVYFYTLNVSGLDFVKSRKMVLLK